MRSIFSVATELSQMNLSEKDKVKKILAHSREVDNHFNKRR